MAVVDRPEQVDAPPGPAFPQAAPPDPLLGDVDPLHVDGHEVDAFDPTPVPSRPRVLSPRDPVAKDVLALAGVLAILAFLWGRQRGIVYWHDEGISIGISSHPLAEIPRLLRQDGPAVHLSHAPGDRAGPAGQVPQVRHGPGAAEGGGP
jgi:hypothetical protein